MAEIITGLSSVHFGSSWLVFILTQTCKVFIRFEAIREVLADQLYTIFLKSYVSKAMSSSVSPHLPASGAGGLPQPLTFIYKSLPNISLKADIYISEPSEHTPPSPILLYLHSGGWIFGSRKEFSQAYFQEFLRRGFVIVSADYRLLPESDFLTGQLEDIRDIEVWLREDLPQLIRDLHQTKLDPKKIVVLGASAGAHLALLTV